MELFNLLAKLTLDTKEYDKAVKKAQTQKIELPDAQIGLDKSKLERDIAAIPKTKVGDIDDEPKVTLDKEQFDNDISAIPGTHVGNLNDKPQVTLDDDQFHQDVSAIPDTTVGNIKDEPEVTLDDGQFNEDIEAIPDTQVDDISDEPEVTLDTYAFQNDIDAIPDTQVDDISDEPEVTLDTETFQNEIDSIPDTYVGDIDKEPVLSLDKTNYDAGIAEAGEEAETFEGQAGGAFERVGELLETAGIVVALGKIATAFKGALDYTTQLGDSIDKGSRRMGISTKAYQEWDHALSQSGGSVQDLNRGLLNTRKAIESAKGVTDEEKAALDALGISLTDAADGHTKTRAELQKEVEERRKTSMVMKDQKQYYETLASLSNDYAAATGDAADAYAKLGISMTDENGNMKTAEQLTEEAMTALAEYVDLGKDLNERDSIVDTLFGRNAGGIKPLLDAGVEGMKNLVAEANELGLVMSDEDIQKAVEYGDAMANLKEELARLQVDFAEVVLPPLTEAVKAVTEIIAFFRGQGWGAGLSVGMTVATAAIGKKVVSWGASKLLGKALGNGSGGSDIVTGGGTGGGSGTGGIVKKGLLAKAGSFIKSGFAANGLWALTPAAVFAAGIAPGLIAQNEAIENMREEQAQMEQNAAKLEAENSENAQFVRTTAKNSYLVKDENGNERKNFLGQSYSQLTDETFASLMGLKDRSGAEMAKLQWMLGGVVNPMTGNYAWTDLQKLWNGELEANDAPELAKAIADALSQKSTEDLWAWQRGSGFAYREDEPEVPVDPTIDDSGMADLQKQLDEGNFSIDVMPSIIGMFGGNKHASGAWDIPYDNYPALLHRDEMVLTASRARRYRDGEGYGLDYEQVGEMIGVAIENAMGRVMVMMSGEKVGDLTTKRVKKNINASSFAKVHALGG